MKKSANNLYDFAVDKYGKKEVLNMLERFSESSTAIETNKIISVRGILQDVEDYYGDDLCAV